MNKKVAEWYREAYPEDTGMHEELNKDVAFVDVMFALGKGDSIYSLLCCDDSIVRERVFDELAKLANVDYNIIYYKWLNI